MVWLILLGVGALSFWALTVLAQILWPIFTMICNTIWECLFSLYRYIFVAQKLEKDGYADRKRIEDKIEQAAREEDINKNTINQQNQLVQAALNSVNQMRIKYPYADESLYDYYRHKFAASSPGQLAQIENEIRNSHLDNEIKYSIQGKESIIYSLADLNGMTPLEERREDPLIFRIFKINTDNILYIHNIDENTYSLLQSKDYFVIIRTVTELIKVQRKLHEQKQNIKTEQISNIYNDVLTTTEAFRRNRMGYID